MGGLLLGVPFFGSEGGDEAAGEVAEAPPARPALVTTARPEETRLPELGRPENVVAPSGPPRLIAAGDAPAAVRQEDIDTLMALTGGAVNKPLNLSGLSENANNAPRPRGGDASSGGAAPVAPPARPAPSPASPPDATAGLPALASAPIARGAPAPSGGGVGALGGPVGAGGSAFSIGAPPVVTVFATDPGAAEGGDEAEFTFYLSAPQGDWLTVYYDIGGTATPFEDFDGVYPEYGFVEFPPFTTEVTIEVPAFYDGAVEPDETVELWLLEDPSGGLPLYTIGTPDEAVITIDDDPPPVITVTASDPTSSEDGPSSGSFTFYRDDDELDRPVTIYYEIGGTAESEEDYTGLAPDDEEWPDEMEWPDDFGMLTFPPDVTQIVVPYWPGYDNLTEGTETVEVTILETDWGLYDVGEDDTATGTIADETPPPVAVTAPGSLAYESGLADGTVIISREGDTSQELTVYFAVGGTAIPGVDYVEPWEYGGPGTGTVVIPEGLSFVALSVHALQDNEVEGLETVVVTPGLPGAPTGPSASTGVVDDPPRVTVWAADAEACPDPADMAEFVVVRTGGDLSLPLAVAYEVGGTAIPEVDYDAPWGAAAGGIVVIPAWASAADLEVLPRPNEPGEEDETVIVALAAPPFAPEEGYLIEEPDVAVAYVRVGPPPPIRVEFREESSAGLETTAQPQIAVVLSRASTQAVTVELGVTLPAPGSDYRPSEGDDFTYTGAQLTFQPGETLKYLPGFVVINDAPQELNEYLTFQLTGATNATVGPRKAHTYTIVDERGGLLNAKTANGANYAGLTYTGYGAKVGVIEYPDNNTGGQGVIPAKSHLGGRLVKDQDFRNPATFPVTTDQATTPRTSDHASLVADAIGSNDAFHAGVAPLATLFAATISKDAAAGLKGLKAAVNYYRSSSDVGLFNHSHGIFNLRDNSGFNDEGKNPYARFLDWYARTYDTLHVVGAGNDGNTSQIGAPGDLYNGITVGAVNSSYKARAHYSSYWLAGDGERADGRGKPEIVAFGGDGVDQPQVQMSNGLVRDFGTSFAAPQVTGVAALLADQSLPNFLQYGRGRSDHLVAKAIILNSARKRGVNGPAANMPEDYTTTRDQYSDADYLGANGLTLRSGGSAPPQGGPPPPKTRFWTPSAWKTDHNGYFVAYKPLDDETGTGLLDARRAITQHQAGPKVKGNVPAIGWSVGSAAPADGAQRYDITSQINQGQFITVTVCWDRVLDERQQNGTAGNGVFEESDTYDDHPDGANDLGVLPAFEVQIYDGIRPVAVASGVGDSVTHLHIPVPDDSDQYNIRVVPKGNVTVTKKATYTVAWWAAQN